MPKQSQMLHFSRRQIQEFERAKREGFDHATEPEQAEIQPQYDARRVITADPFQRHDRKVGRNEPCPCGSGRKYKRCHHPRAVR